MTHAEMREVGSKIIALMKERDASPDEGKTILLNVLAVTIATTVGHSDEIADEIEATQRFLADAAGRAFVKRRLGR